MNLFDAWWKNTHSHGTPSRLPQTALLGIPYQPDWFDVFGVIMVFLPVILLALGKAIR